VTARVALYYAPSPDDPLWAAGNAWLGRDPEANIVLPQPDLPNIHAVTSDARLYGFHATLKPPMRLRGTFESLATDAKALCSRIAPFDLPPLAITDLHGFLALCESAPTPALHALADACVAGVDHHRQPPDEAELVRRRKGGLSPERDAMLQRWGYPDVFTTWRFHMTLTRRLIPDEATLFRPAAAAHFRDVLETPRRVHEVCLFVQPEAGASFRLARRLPLGQAAN